MKKASVFLCFVSIAGACAGCSCGDSRPANSVVKEMSLRIVPFGRFGASHSISVMIVGQGKALDVNELSIVDIQAEDQEGRHFPVSLERHPGESSKYGPYVSLTLDAKEAKGYIAVAGHIAYKAETYTVKARYLPGAPGDTYFWREDEVMLDR